MSHHVHYVMIWHKHVLIYDIKFHPFCKITKPELVSLKLQVWLCYNRYFLSLISVARSFGKSNEEWNIGNLIMWKSILNKYFWVVRGGKLASNIEVLDWSYRLFLVTLLGTTLLFVTDVLWSQSWLQSLDLDLEDLDPLPSSK